MAARSAFQRTARPIRVALDCLESVGAEFSVMIRAIHQSVSKKRPYSWASVRRAPTSGVPEAATGYALSLRRTPDAKCCDGAANRTKSGQGAQFGHIRQASDKPRYLSRRS